MADAIPEALRALEAADRLRGLVPVRPLSAVRVLAGGRELVLFSSNDYLGLSAHPEVREAAARASLERGIGARSSALICGYSDQHEALESDLAELKGTDAALVFPTGYSANLGLLGAIGGPSTAIFSDQRNHASIIDGCRLARSSVQVYRHRDVDHLDELLSQSAAERKVVVTDALFSMDGHPAPLREIAALKKRHDFVLAVDEAHATLVLGSAGGGLVEATGTHDAVDFHVGTLSKAFGAHGGFVACSVPARTWLLNRARAYVFSTALPVPLVAAARAAIRVTREEPDRRERLWERVAQLGRALDRRLHSPIVPVVLGDEQSALRASRSLLERGMHVTAIRPPTVAPGTCRLRVALSAEHSESDVDDLAQALDQLEHVR